MKAQYIIITVLSTCALKERSTGNVIKQGSRAELIAYGVRMGLNVDKGEDLAQ